MNGFTLIEILVVIAVVGIISVLVVVAYPNARDGQKLVLAEQQLQAILREAQQRTINEERDAVCIANHTPPTPPPDPLYLERLCSDIGVKLDTDEFILFADTTDFVNDSWDPGSDYEIKRISFPDGVQVASAGTSSDTFIFQGAPPTVALFTPGGAVPATTPETVVFTAGDSVVTLNIYSYGQVERF